MYKNTILSIPRTWQMATITNASGDENSTKLSIFWTFLSVCSDQSICAPSKIYLPLMVASICIFPHFKVDSKLLISLNSSAKNVDSTWIPMNSTIDFIWIKNSLVLNAMNFSNKIHVFGISSERKISVKLQRRKFLIQMCLLFMETLSPREMK